MILFVAFLLLSGCAAESLASRSMNCRPVESEECEKLRKQFDRQVERKKKLTCPSGQIVIVQGGRSGCMSRGDFGRWQRYPGFPND